MRNNFETETNPFEAESPGASLTPEERQAIFMRVDLRRQAQELKVGLLNLELPESTEAHRKKYEETISRVKKEADGAEKIPKEEAERFLKEEAEDVRNRADLMQEMAPDLSAYLLAKIAKNEQAVGIDFQRTLKEIEEVQKFRPSVIKISPSNLLADATVIGIQKLALEKLSFIAIEKLGQATADDQELLKALALTLNESERKKFLDCLPEGKKRRISALMDKELSSLLSEKLVSEADIPQRDAVKERSSRELETAVSLKQAGFGRPLVKELAETLSNLDGEDSKRLLQEIGTMALRTEHDPNKRRERLSYASRIFKTLAEIDQNKGNNLTMKFLGKREVPPRLFRYFCQRLLRDGFLTANLESYLLDKNLPFLKRLIAEKPNQFNTLIDTVSQIPNYDILDHQEEILGALKDLEAITPIIFERYRHSDKADRKELVEKIKGLKANFFKNIPIGDILPRKDKDILAEMVYLAYRPVGMSFNDVEGLIGRLNDQTEDLEGYKFPLDGYDFSLESQANFLLKDGEKLNDSLLRELRHLFDAPPFKEQEIKPALEELFASMLKATSQLKPEEIALVLTLISNDEQIANFKERYESLNEENAYNFLTELKENLGIYFKDHFQDRLAYFFVENPEVEERLVKIISNPKRQKVLQAQMGKDSLSIDWTQVQEKEVLSQLLSIFISTKVLKSAKTGLAREINKFEHALVKSTFSGVEMKAYISKNIGSFFAKASAGICTAEDVGLFERQDHFHINIVEKDSAVRANIQAYIIEDGNKKSLVLRGFNPNTDFESKIDIASFCEKVIAVARQFISDNGLKSLYITEQGNWHALSNRAKVANYLISKYHKKASAKAYSLRVSDAQTITTIYQL